VSLRSITRDALAAVGVKPGWQFRFLPYRSLRQDRHGWNAEFRSGHWQSLKSRAGLARYGTIAGFCRHFAPGGSVLDVGCGEGLLLDHLHGYSKYLGVDVSDEAVNRARLEPRANASFVQGDACEYVPDSRFNVIVFNECLFYFEDPLGVMQRYQRILEPSGVMIASIYVMGLDRRVWSMIESAYRILTATLITNPNPQVSWTVKVLAPR